MLFFGCFCWLFLLVVVFLFLVGASFFVFFVLFLGGFVPKTYHEEGFCRLGLKGLGLGFVSARLAKGAFSGAFEAPI